MKLAPMTLAAAPFAITLSALSACSHAPPPAVPTTAAGDVLFTEDFESDLGQWEFPLGQGHALVARADGAGTALKMETRDLPVYALVAGSESWDGVRIEGEVLFPDGSHNYLGFIYGYTDDGRRIDFGSLYIKGNGSYVQANPHYDTNVGRTLYPEIRNRLEGPAAIVIGTWQRFALEVVAGEAHLYVGPSATPSLTLPFGSPARGAFGFKPRNPGGAVLIDDLTVTEIDALSHGGPAVPEVDYDPTGLLTDWLVLGPLDGFAHQVESEGYSGGRPVRSGDRTVGWRPFPVDARGALVTGAVVEHRGARRVAYFRTVIEAPRSGPATLELSTVDAVALWLNGEFLGYGPGQGAAWWDVGANPARSPITAPIDLEEGANELLIRVVGGQYATGGLYVRLAR